MNLPDFNSPGADPFLHPKGVGLDMTESAKPRAPADANCGAAVSLYLHLGGYAEIFHEGLLA